MTDDLNLMGDAKPFPHFVSGYDQIIFIPLSLQGDHVIGILLEIELGCFPDNITLLPVDISCMLLQFCIQFVRDTDGNGSCHLL